MGEEKRKVQAPGPRSRTGTELCDSKAPKSSDHRRFRGGGRRFLSLLVTLCLMIGLMPMPMAAAASLMDIYVKATYTGNTSDGTANRPYKTVDDAINAINAASDSEAVTIHIQSDVTVNNQIVLTSTKPVTITSDGGSFSIYRGVTATGDLFTVGLTPGQYLDGRIPSIPAQLTLTNITIDGNNIASSGPLIFVSDKATLTMERGAVIQRNNAADPFSCGVFIGGTFIMNDGEVRNNRSIGVSITTMYGPKAKFIMNGGKITGNTGTGVSNAGTFKMNGGEISGNKESWSGGGVSNAGTFEMNGGRITGNTANENGGGVHLEQYNTFTMTGGEITNNKATGTAEGSGGYGGGVYVNKNAVVTLGGDPSKTITISGNQSRTGTSNLYLDYFFDNGKLVTKTIAFLGDMAASSSIGVEVSPYNSSVTVASSGATETHVRCFTSDVAGYYPELGDNGILSMVRTPGLKGTVTISPSENLTEGTVLTVNTDGLNSGGIERNLTYQWYRDGALISGATDSTYRLTAADIGKEIKVEVKNPGNSGSVFSEAVQSTVPALLEIPDANFRKAILTKVFDLADGEREDPNPAFNPDQQSYPLYSTDLPVIKAVTSLDVSGCGITDMTGIAYFENLTALNCNGNFLTSLFVVENRKLEDLKCGSNQLEALSLGNNLKLKSLYCPVNRLTALNVSENPNLQTLWCSKNELETLDLSRNEELLTLYCSYNELTALDIQQNTKLTRVECEKNNLAVLSLGENTRLTSLSCQNNKLRNLNVGGATALRYLYCGNNQLTTLDLQTNTALNTVDCMEQQRKLEMRDAALDLAVLTGNDGRESELFYVKAYDGYGRPIGTTAEYSSEDGTVTFTEIPKYISYYLSVLPSEDPEEAVAMDVLLINTRPAVAVIDSFDTSSGTGIYDAGDTVTIHAGSRDSYVFTGWTSEEVDLSDATSLDTTFVMPDKDVFVTANWAYHPRVTVIGSYAETSGEGMYTVGETVTVHAGSRDGYIFSGWTSEDVTLTTTTSPDATFTMPEHAVTVTANWTRTPRVAVVDSYAETSGEGVYTVGETVTVHAGSRGGYTFSGWTSGDVTLTNATSPDATFTMPEHDVTVTAAWRVQSSGGGGSSSPAYPVIVNDTENGSIKASSKNAKSGDTVTITVLPDKNHKLDGLTVTDGNGKPIKITDKGDGRYTFRMPGSKVIVKASFVAETAVPENPFSDVTEGDYCYDAMMWAYQSGIAQGSDAHTFAPNIACTRAQLVTFLWRAAGSPILEKGTNPFIDVAPDSYYYNAVVWAAERGIAKGTTDTTFTPDRTVTRGEAVTFLWRAAGFPKTDSAITYGDVAPDAYCASAVRWAAEMGITVGYSSDRFLPGANCTRGQAVTFLYRWLSE